MRPRTEGHVDSSDAQSFPIESCPDKVELTAFAQGALPDARCEVITEHVAGCAACDALLKASVEEQVAALRALLAAPDDPVVAEPECARLEELAKAIPIRRASGSEDDATFGTLDVPAYEVTRCIATGPNGTCYLGRHAEDDRWVTLKALSASVAKHRTRLKSYRHSIETASTLKGCPVLPLLDVCETEAALVLVTPYIDGISLKSVVRARRGIAPDNTELRGRWWARYRGRKYLSQILLIVDQLIGALAQLHAAGLAYRDIKTSNCLLDDAGRLWLTDFGLTDLLDHWGNVVIRESREKDRRRKGAKAGPTLQITEPALISPEQWAGCADVDLRADVFRLGVVVYQLLTLELPYGNAVVTPRRPPPKRPSAHQRWLPAAFDDALLKALAPDREQRYPTAVEFGAHWRVARALSAASFRGMRGVWNTIIDCLGGVFQRRKQPHR